ncbi:MAG: deoxyuridine 5'-triphosphate nucleotidohydrolase [Halolamina sp.]
MFRSGAFVAEHVTPVTDEQIQPNGVDLTLESVFEQREPGFIGQDGKEVGARQHRLGGPLVDEPSGEQEGLDMDEEWDGTYYLPRGGYVVGYAEIVEIPENHVGFIYPRSSLLRNSCMLNTAVWDAGYTGKGEGLLQVHHDIEIEAGARIAQLVLAKADHEETYDGSYQGERMS